MKRSEPTEFEWVAGPPPKAGAYRVRCEGPSPNIGYRYWTGERWGHLCSSRAWCIKGKGVGPRVVTLKRAVLWERRNPNYLTLEQQRDLLLTVMAEVLRISDRKHDAWDAAKAAIARCTPQPADQAAAGSLT